MEQLYERYSHLVLGVCIKYLKDTEAAKDATQQIFIKLLEDLKRFNIEKFKPWLFQVARNFCLMQLRSSIPVVKNEFITNSDMEFEDGWHHKVEQEEMLVKLEDAIKELNKEQRICIEKFYLEKMTYAEISQNTGYDLLQVKSCIQNGKRNLRIRIEAKGGVQL